jgi:predicted transcriptional regulator of viral defense system
LIVDWTLARGQHFVTTDEVARLVGVEPDIVSVSLQHAREAPKIVSVTKGAWVPVPPEYRAAGAPPPLHYIDPLMRHLGHPYYVGLLSAARLHGDALADDAANTLLDPRGPRHGRRDRRWHLLANTDIEHDL